MFDLNRSALIAEIVGAIAVVISIVFLIIEIRANTSAQQLLATQQVLGISVQTNSDVALGFDEIGPTNEKYFQGEELTSSESVRFSYFWNSTFAAFWQVHFQYSQGYLNQEMFEAYERRIIATISLPRMLEFWDSNKFRYSDSFQTYIDGLAMEI